MRLSGLLTQLPAALAVSSTGDPDMVSFYYFATALLPLVVTVAGLELHSVTDRLVVNGMPPRDALRWLLTRESVVVLCAAIALGAYDRYRDLDATAWLLLATAFATLIHQETFRVLVARDAQLAASLTLFVRTGLPFAVIAALAVGGRLSEVLMVATVLAGAVVAAITGYWQAAGLQRRVSAEGVRLAKLTATRTASTMFASAVLFRLLLSGDLVLLAHHLDLRLYGFATQASLAAFMLVDVVVVQWRYKAILSHSGDMATVRRSASIAAVVAGVVTAVTGFYFIVVHVPDATPADCAVAVAVGAFAALSCASQLPHLQLYAAGREGVLLRVYACAGLAFALAGLLALWTGQVLVVVLAKVVVWWAVHRSLVGSRNGIEVVAPCLARA